MCRQMGPHYRRCPYHTNPSVMAVANAKTSVRRLEKRVDQLEQDGAPDSVLNRGLERLYRAHERLGSREQHAIPETGRPGAKPPASAVEIAEGAGEPVEPQSYTVLPAPRPSAADSLTSESVERLSWDEVAELYERHGDDPEAMEKLEILVDEREAREAGEENDSSAWQQSEPPYGLGSDLSNPTLRTVRKLKPHEVAREEYDNYVYAQYAKCESELSFLVNEKGRRAGVDAMSLFTGPVSRAKKYGTPELQSWFAANGRHTLGSFRYGLFGWASDSDANRRHRLEGWEDAARTF